MRLPPAGDLYDRENENEARFLTSLEVDALEARVTALEAAPSVNPPPIGPGPVASFSTTRSAKTVTFTDTSTDTAPGTIVTWAWDFGDAAVSSIRNPVHTYNADGTYSARLTVTDNDNLTSTKTVSITITTTAPGTGIPYGAISDWASSTTRQPNTAVFTLSLNAESASTIVANINAARTAKVKLLIAMTGGDHNNYITNGTFELINGHIAGSKWAIKQNTFNTSAIKTAMATAVSDGTVVGASVIDEPMHASWGGVMTKALVDEMGSFVKAIFPTLPVGCSLGSQYDWLQSTNFTVLDFFVTQYSWRFGDVVPWRTGALASATRNGTRVCFSVNVLNGGTRVTGCPIPQTGGAGTLAPNCRTTPQQILDFCSALGPFGCGLTMWEYDSGFFADSGNQNSFASVAALLAPLTAVPWTRP